MDGGFRDRLESDTDFTLSYALEAQNNVQSWSQFSTDTTLRLESPATSIVYDSNSIGTKRKLFDVCGTKDHKNASQPLLFGNSLSSLGSSKRSSTTMCTDFSARECSMDLNVNFRLHQGGDSMGSTKNPSVTAPKAIQTGLDLDLHLSLPVELSESAATVVTTVSSEYECISKKAVTISQGPTAGDASTSAFCMYGGSSSPYLTSSEIPPKANPIKNPDLPSSKTEALSSPVTCTSGMVVQSRKRSTKNCEVPGCVKGARGASGLCIAHGGGWRCQKDGCHKGAEGKTIYCKAHGGGRRCQKLGCTKSADGRTDLCIAHGGGNRCSYEGCKHAARGKSGFCIKHRGGKRCKEEKCTKSAEGYSGRCISHGGGRRCLFPACTKGAQGGGTMLCKAHGGGKRCTFPECTKGAEGSTPFCKGHGGGKRCTFEGGCSKSIHGGGTPFCVAHGGGKRCAVADCTKSARGGYDCCVRHGGGKRCKSAGCDKSAHGSTDFCKAHEGGKKSAPHKLGSGFGFGQLPPDQFAKGKIGLCAAFGPMGQDQRIHGGATLGPLANPQFETLVSSKSKMKGIIEEDVFSGQKKISDSSMLTFHPGPHSIRESRVHGGNLMAMLAFGSADHGGDSESPDAGESSDERTKNNV